ncbi:MAG: DUF4142 domain-containing protein [Vulcanimicrobiota bacterium]
MKIWFVLICLSTGLAAEPLRADYFWASKAGEVSQEMCRYGTLALQRSRDPRVLAEARQLVRDGQLNFQRLALVAEHRQFPLPTGPTAAQQLEYVAMAQLQDSQFDQAFLRKERECGAALSLCRNQALARSRDPVLSEALRGLDLEAASH